MVRGPLGKNVFASLAVNLAARLVLHRREGHALFWFSRHILTGIPGNSAPGYGGEEPGKYRAHTHRHIHGLTDQHRTPMDRLNGLRLAPRSTQSRPLTHQRRCNTPSQRRATVLQPQPMLQLNPASTKHRWHLLHQLLHTPRRLSRASTAHLRRASTVHLCRAQLQLKAMLLLLL